MGYIEDSQGIAVVKALLMWDKRAGSREHLKALDTVGMIDWADERGALTADAARLKRDLHRAKGNDRWAMCKALAETLNTEMEKKQRGLF